MTEETMSSALTRTRRGNMAPSSWILCRLSSSKSLCLSNMSGVTPLSQQESGIQPAPNPQAPLAGQVLQAPLAQNPGNMELTETRKSFGITWTFTMIGTRIQQRRWNQPSIRRSYLPTLCQSHHLCHHHQFCRPLTLRIFDCKTL